MSLAEQELRAVGWCGAKYLRRESKHGATGNWVALVCGFDSDEEDTYQPIDIAAAAQVGTLGLSADEVGQRVNVEDHNGAEPSLCQLQHPNGAYLVKASASKTKGLRHKKNKKGKKKRK